MAEDLAFIKQIEAGRWKIIENQMIFYKSNGTEALITFNLKDAEGEPTETDAYERIPI